MITNLRRIKLIAAIALLPLLACVFAPLEMRRALAAESLAAFRVENLPKHNGWRAALGEYNSAPPRLVAVAKNRQQLFMFEKNSPLRVAAEYQCTTGQVVGDKQQQNDLKTPEGVYFVTGKIDSGLDFEKYGYEAYPLNYPNPVDRLRRKTGYGIWIHGRGTELTPLQTQGCVSLNNTDIAVLGNNLTKGTPVALASDVSPAELSPADKMTIALLEQKVQGWAKAWGSRSRAMFDYYDPQAYSVAQEDFSAFRSQKERIFSAMPWIETKISDVQVLPGPGYWVTWFFQEYKAPNLATKGVRRLYWQEDAKGELRIVGMEWEPGLAPQSVLLAESSQNASMTAGKTVSDSPAGLVAGLDGAASPETGREEKPVLVAVNTADSLRVAAPAVLELPEGQVVAQPGEQVESTSVPSSADEGALAEKETPPAHIPLGEEFTEVYAARKREPAADATAVPAGGKKTDDSADSSAKQGRDFVENWRKAWEKGDLDAYMACYAPNAEQGDKKGAKAIAAHKRQLWKTRAPGSVRFANMKITPAGSEGGGLRVEMAQNYKDKSGYKDRGRKVLQLRKVKGAWKIISEDWDPLTP